MTFSLRRKRRTTVREKNTPSRTIFSPAVAVLLAAVLPVSADLPSGQPRSQFVPRGGAAAGSAGLPMVPPPPIAVAPPTVAPATAPSTTQTPPRPSTVVRAQATLPSEKRSVDPYYDTYVRLEPPGKERLFGSRDTERELEERMKQEARDAKRELPAFPVPIDLGSDPLKPRQFPAMTMVAEPAYVVHHRLYFEEVNTERYGWDLGILQPVVSTLYFYRDVALWPHNFASQPQRRFDTNYGKCWPGDPVPYILYPPEFTWFGGAVEAGTLITLFAVVP